MGQTYENPHHIRFSGDDSSGSPRVPSESSQCTIRMKVDEPDMKDSPQDAPEECSYYHKYVIPEEYANWICDQSWPETDSESEISNPPLYDKWVQEEDENEESSSETEDESPEPTYPGEKFTEPMRIEMGFEILETIPGSDVLLHMTPVTDFINNLEGYQLVQSAARGLETFRKHPLSGDISRIPFQTICTLLQGLGQGQELFKALQAVQAIDQSKLRDIVHDAIWTGDKGNVVFILRPNIEALPYTDQNKFVVKTLETFESMYSSTRKLPDDEDLEMC